MTEQNDDRVAELVDDQLRFLRGEGPEPDVSGLSVSERAQMVELLNLVDALVDSRPLSPPLGEDPVAIRLGLVPGKPGPAPADLTEPLEPTDPIVVSTEELRYRFGEAVEVDHSVAITSADDNQFSPAVLCRALAENVLVVAFCSADPIPSTADAGALLRANPSLTAIAFTTPDAAEAAVVVPGDTVDRLSPAEGWLQPAELAWEPLGIALGRHFDKSIPHWDAVASLPRTTLIDELGADALAVVTATLDSVATTRPQLAHKRQARDFVATINSATVVTWADDIRSGRATGSDVVAAINSLCQETNP